MLFGRGRQHHPQTDSPKPHAPVSLVSGVHYCVPQLAGCPSGLLDLNSSISMPAGAVVALVLRKETPSVLSCTSQVRVYATHLLGALRWVGGRLGSASGPVSCALESRTCRLPMGRSACAGRRVMDMYIPAPADDPRAPRRNGVAPARRARYRSRQDGNAAGLLDRPRGQLIARTVSGLKSAGSPSAPRWKPARP